MGESKGKQRWQDTVAAKLTPRQTLSGLPVEPLYMPQEQPDGYDTQLGMPGEYPFTRGVYSTMYLERPWTLRQYSGFGTAEDTNARYKRLLAEGQTGLSVAFDLPTQLGLDSDSEEAEVETGRVGVAVSSLADFEVLFDGIPLDKVSTSFTINSTAPIILAMYMLVAQKQGVPLGKVAGTIQNDILKEFVARGTWIFPVEPSVRLVTDALTFSVENLPRFNPISIAGAHFRDACATAMQEAAFTLAENLGVVNRLSLSLEKTFSASFSAQQFSRLPQGSEAGGIAPRGLPNLENIRDFPALVQSVLESVFDAHSRVGQDQSLIRSYQDFLQFIQTYFDDLNASLQPEPGVSENPEDSSTRTVA